jgi:mono/diheme cytochrome c family protein
VSLLPFFVPFVLSVLLVVPTPAAEPTPNVDFAREVFPLLKRACFECHGEKKQEGGLRLDSRDAALAGGDSGKTIVAGHPDQSELILRISQPKNSDGVMPALGDTLTPDQIKLVRRWIEAGAPWPDKIPALHWAYVSPVRPGLPTVKDSTWPKTPIDYFILNRLEREGLSPSPAADPATLIRRLYLDLIGLPPSPEELDAFISDLSPNAYEHCVDRLLASPQFGVRWARPWLDYARYADSHGFQRDDLRDNWAFRDWVVRAFNSDMPFDQFTIEQLAGDLLPNATESQRIASGFNRNAPTNVEAGSDPEETRVNQVLDRVNTLGMVWLGTTLECCQCHDHKYDPFSARDYYGLFAFFNNTAIEAQRSNPKVPGSIRFLGPEMPLRDDKLDQERTRVSQQLDKVKSQIAALEDEHGKSDPAWEASLLETVESASREEVLNIVEFDSLGGATHEVLPDQSVLLSGEAPDRDTYTVTAKTSLKDIRAIKLEALTDPSLPGKGPGRGDEQRPNFVLNTLALEAGPVSGEAQAIAFVGAKADYSQARFDASGAIDQDPKTGWAIHPKFHEPHWAVFELAEPLGDGAEQILKFRLEQNHGGSRTIGRLRLAALSGQSGQPALPANLVTALKVASDKRSKEQTQTIVTYRLKNHQEYSKLQTQKTKLDAELAKLKPPTTLFMDELDQPRPAAMFVRGDFRTPGEAVQPATPTVLHRLRPLTDRPESGSTESQPPATRLELAQWLVRDDNPLTARVVVNRFWSELFGHGLVTTPEDFGLKGEFPTHPELLDWLAIEYMQRDWSLKQWLKQIVLSATYRQSARVTPELIARDDRNLLYARGSRFRLDAEAVRDNALAIAGLLSLDQSGQAIRPPQPDGIWIKVGGQRYDYVVSPGEQQYRRGLFVVWKRGAPYPSFMNFDANNRMTCRVQRPRSNTPLQALTLMNDPVYVDAAKAFARRILTETPQAAFADRARHAFRIALTRAPKGAEVAALESLFQQQLAASREDSKGTAEFVNGVELPAGIAADEFVAWYAVATALLNLDETISRG